MLYNENINKTSFLNYIILRNIFLQLCSNNYVKY